MGQSLLLPGEGMQGIWEGNKNCANSEGRGAKYKAFYMKEHGLSSQALKGGPKFLQQAEKGDEISMKQGHGH